MSGVMSGSVFKSKDGVASGVYRFILGGRESDRALYEKSDVLVKGYVAKQDVLDTGCGNGRYAISLARDLPASITVTDYEPDAAKKVAERLRDLDIQPRPKIKFTGFDVRYPNELIHANHYRLVVCNSVAMHMVPEDSALAICNLSACLASGGRLVFGVLSTEVALQCFIPAPWIGENAFYPALKDVPRNASKEDIPPGAECLFEYYPEQRHYVDACKKACEMHGCTLTKDYALGGKDCANGIYSSFVGKPLWHMYVIDKA